MATSGQKTGTGITVRPIQKSFCLGAEPRMPDPECVCGRRFSGRRPRMKGIRNRRSKERDEEYDRD